MRILKKIAPTAERKNYLFLFVFIVVIILAYNLAFSPTFRQIEINKSLTSELIGLDDATSISKMQTQSDFYDHYIYPGSQIAFQNLLIEQIATISSKNKAKMTSFSIEDVENIESWERKLYRVDMTGSFVSILKSVEEFKNGLEGGILKNMAFKMSKNTQTRKTYLECNLYVQSISRQDSESIKSQNIEK